MLRRDAQSLVAQQKLQVTNGGFGRRSSSQADVELWFALSAFADNASLYEQLVRGNTGGASSAGTALVNAARRVDNTLVNARTTSTIQNSWSSIRSRLAVLDSSYR